MIIIIAGSIIMYTGSATMCRLWQNRLILWTNNILQERLPWDRELQALHEFSGLESKTAIYQRMRRNKSASLSALFTLIFCPFIHYDHKAWIPRVVVLGRATVHLKGPLKCNTVSTVRSHCKHCLLHRYDSLSIILTVDSDNIECQFDRHQMTFSHRKWHTSVI